MKNPHTTGLQGHRMRGFSLVEMMVALVITLILMAGIAQIYLGSKKSYVIQDALGRMQENGRYAMENLISDVRRAGYWGGNANINDIEDNTTGGAAMGNVIAVDNGTCTDVNWARMLTHRIFGKDDNRTSYGCLEADAAHVGDILVLRYAAPWTIGGITTDANHMVDHPTHFYIRSSLFSGKLFEGEDEAANAVTGANVRTSELVSNGYYIHRSANSDPNKCPGSNAIPSLYRVHLEDGALASEEVAYGVEQFQVQYGIDTDNDDSVDSYIDAPAAGSAQWGQVIAARLWLLMRAECPETDFTNASTYRMGNLPPYTPADNYRRQLYTSTVSLRNKL